MPPRKEQTQEDRDKMLARLAEGRKKIAENREKKKLQFEEKGEEETPVKVFEKKEIKPPASAPIKIQKTTALKRLVPEDKLEKIASQLDELTSYKREKIELKKKKEEDDTRIKRETEENDMRMKKEKEELDLKNKLERLAHLEEKEKQKSLSTTTAPPSKPKPTLPTSSVPEIIFPRSYKHPLFQGGRF